MQVLFGYSVFKNFQRGRAGGLGAQMVPDPD